MSWVWLIPLGLAAGAACGLWVALARLRREARALARASAALAAVQGEARLRRAPERD